VNEMADSYIKTKANEIIEQLSEEQKAALCVGKDYWNTMPLPAFDLDSLRMSDGPHGLRVQSGDADFSGIHPSAPAICFPAACLSACSFEPDLLYEMGQALGQEAKKQDVQVLLGPGINIKRVPWGGRNFEYFSEDPLLSGILGAAFVKGVQSQGVQCALKHFACNSQEQMRMSSNSIVDEAALHEIYLPAFQYVIAHAHPAWIMTSYNLINGIYASQNKELMDLARSWGFDGAFVTDWGGLNEPAASFENGTDLEMPGLSKGSQQRIVKQVSAKRRNEAALHIIENMLKAQQEKQKPPQKELDGLVIAQKVAERSMVLLKNKNHILPLKKECKIALIGSMAQKPRYQGAGSSKVNPIEVDNLKDVFAQRNLDFSYAQGAYEDGSTDEILLAQALEQAKKQDVVVAVIGLPEIDESEGYDRKHLKLPAGMLQLLCTLKKANKPIVVILQCGSVVELPFKEEIDGLLLGYLGGSAHAKATARILFGEVSPSGKLAETWPLKESDVPIVRENEQVHYKESLFCGYRYYSSALMEVAYPFGYGLSYTRFAFANMEVLRTDTGFDVQVDLSNIGSQSGAQVVQLYIQNIESKRAVPVRKLAAFKKVDLQIQESKTVSFHLDWQTFQSWDRQSHAYKLYTGEYSLQIGSSSEHMELEKTVWIMGEEACRQTCLYDDLSTIRSMDPLLYEAFANIHTLPKPLNEKPYDFNVRICDIKKNHRFYKALLDWIIGYYLDQEENEQTRKMLEAIIEQMPLRLLGMYGLSKNQIDGVVDVLNRHYIQGTKKLLKA
jgi:beta-glucosidase